MNVLNGLLKGQAKNIVRAVPKGTGGPTLPKILTARWMATDSGSWDKAKEEPIEDQPLEEEKVTEELVEETETVTGAAKEHQFQAETQQLLQIVAHSLYSNKDVFVRELISNASDALEKLRYIERKGERIADSEQGLEIRLSVDANKKTFTIQDTGIGMTANEMVANLGTIAHSGSKAFLKEHANKQEETANGIKEGIIGQFGVGFYSAFMVGKHVKVYSKPYTAEDDTGCLWESDGSGSYTLTEAHGVMRGTKIIVDLNEKCEEYSSRDHMHKIIHSMSNFVGFPIKLNGEVVNTVQALWMMDDKDITEEMHNEFYKFISQDYQDPRFHLHYKTDVPVDLQALLYVPEMNTEKFDFGYMDGGVSLYCRKVLIQNKFEGILPKWLRFLKGAVDSPDIPLNLSRELLQDSKLIQRLNDILTGRVVRFFENQLKKDPTKYDSFYDEFGKFIREGVCTDIANRQNIAKLLRFETSSADGRTTLAEYITRMPADQKEIFYINVPNRQLAETSPYMEYFKEKNLEVLFTYDRLDGFAMLNVDKFQDKKLQPVETYWGDKDEATNIEESSKELITYMKEVLGESVEAIKVSTRLINSPAVILDHIPAPMRKMFAQMGNQNNGSGRQQRLPPVILEINPSHAILSQALKAKDTDPELAARVVKTVFDTALISADLLEEPRSIVGRLNTLMLDALRPYAEDSK